MKSNLEKRDLISSRYAGQLSGYTSSYLRRLLRSGDIEGVQVGRVWMVKRASLIRFLDAQVAHKEKLSETRSRIHAALYHSHKNAQTPSPKAFQSQRFSRLLDRQERVEVSNFNSDFLKSRSPAFAIAAALLVVGGGALVAQAAFTSQVAEKTVAFAREVASGFGTAFGDIPSRVGSRIDLARSALRVVASPAPSTIETAPLRLAPLSLATIDVSTMRMKLGEDETSRIAFTARSVSAPRVPSITLAGILASARDMLLASPHMVNDLNLALGRTVIDTTHSLINTEVSLVSAPATVAPAIARGVLNTEYVAATRFVALSNTLTERYLALVEHAGAGVGDVAYEGGKTISKADALVGSPTFFASGFSNIASAVQDAWLGTLGKVAAAWEGQTFQNSKGLTFPREMLAAVLAALSPAEQVALATYQSIHGFFTTTARSFASLFGSTSPATGAPPVMTPIIVPPKTLAIATTTPKTPTSIGQKPSTIINGPSYPTYTTLVQGVSQDFVNQSLSSMRNGILATVSGMIQPVSNQVATNIQTIQMVNKIEDLTGLIVRNGNFIGGTFTGGTFSNGLAVSARTGDFSTLTVGQATLTTLAAGQTTLATTTVTGDVTLSGILTANTKAVAPYFVATDALATSTFAGNIDVSAGSAYTYNGVNVITASTTLNNYFFGGAGNLTMTGSLNTAGGSGALASNTTGYWNTALGASALNANTTGDRNTAIGVYSLIRNTTGQWNTGIGIFTLQSNTTGNQNTAEGYGALNYNTTGNYNTALGVGALVANSTGDSNTATGKLALQANITGSNNTANGFYALLSNTSATSSTAVGYQAAAGTAAYNNQGGVYLGYQSGYSAATGSDYNTLLGYQSGYGVTSGARNVLIGQSTIAASMNQVTTGSNNIAIGNDVAVASSTASNQLNIGNLIYGTGLNGTASAISTGRIGIGTTSPDSLLALQQTVNGVPFISAYRVTDAAPAGDFINFKTKAGTTLFRVDNSGNLLAGGIVNSGSQTITSTSTPQFRVQYDASNEITTSVSSTGAASLGINGTSPSLTFTPGSNSTNTFNFTDALATNFVLSIDTFNKRVGIGTTTPLGNGLNVVSNANYIQYPIRIGNIATSGITLGAALIFDVFNGTSIASNGGLLSTASTWNYGTYSPNQMSLGTPGSGGIRLAAASAPIAFFTGNADADFSPERMRISSSGNVGIGTTSPFAKLSVAGNGYFDGTVTASRVNATSSIYVGDGATTLGTINFLDTNGSTNGSITLTGSPQLSLYGYNGLFFKSGQPTVDIDTQSKPTNWKVYGGQTFNFGGYTGYGGEVVMKNLQDGTEVFHTYLTAPYKTVFANGNVGIGTTGPTAKLHSYGGSSGGTVSANSNLMAIESNGNNGLQFLNPSANNANINFGDENNNEIGFIQYQHATDALHFRSGGITGMVIKSGNVGIGTTNPGAELDIYSNTAAHITTLKINGQNGAVGDTSSKIALGILEGGVTPSDIELRAVRSVYVNPHATDFAIAVAGSEWLRITKTGNVGIGTTTPYSRLSVWGADTGANIMANFVNSASTSVMSILNNGNVGIGTTTPAYILQVMGSTGMGVRSTGVDGAFQDIITGLYSGNNTEKNSIQTSVSSVAENSGFEFQLSNGSGSAAQTLGYRMSRGSQRFYIGGTEKMTLDSNGNLIVAGSGTTCTIGNGVGATNCTSDARLKTNITDISGTDALAGLAKIRGVTFNWADPSKDQEQRVGIIAQDVLQAFPQVVGTATTTFDGVSGSYYTVDYAALVSPLIAGVNALNQRTSFIQNAATTTVLTVDVAGNVGIGTNDPSAQKLVVSGNVRVGTGTTGCVEDADGTLIAGTCSSDLRLKTNITPFAPVLDRLVALTPVTYNWRSGEFPDRHLGTSLQTGLIAQEVAAQFPELVTTDDKGFEQITFQYLPFYLLQGIKELNTKLDQQASSTTFTLTSLESRLAALESGAVSSPFSLSSSSLASAIQSITSVLNIGKLVADTFYAARSWIDNLTVANMTVGSSTAASGVTFYDKVTKAPYCFSIENGAPTTTPGVCTLSTEILNPFAASTMATSTSTVSGTVISSVPLTLTLNGATPTRLMVGETYVELGAVVAGGSEGTAPYEISVDGLAFSSTTPVLDTSAPITHILTYHAIDGAGDTATAYRSVIVSSPDATSPATVTASTSPITILDLTATSTPTTASSTATSTISTTTATTTATY